MTDQKKPTLADLDAEYKAALQILEDAQRDASIAGNRECSARNRVNEIQKQISARMDELRKAAPRDSRWRDEDRRGRAAVFEGTGLGAGPPAQLPSHELSARERFE